VYRLKSLSNDNDGTDNSKQKMLQQGNICITFLIVSESSSFVVAPVMDAMNEKHSTNPSHANC
jgi:hypothetical protein